MAEETTNPAQETTETAPEPAPAPVYRPAAVPAAAPLRAETPARKGSPLLTFLIVLLILVGIADVILWGIVGYYSLQNYLNGGGGEPSGVTISGTLTQGASDSGAASGDEAKREALEAYI